MDDELQRKIAGVGSRLAGEYALSSDEIQRHVEAAAARYRNAKVQTFVPTLIERNVRNALHRQRLTPGA
jgi:hypothetical protein